MKDVAHDADVSLSTLYRYFPSKEHLLIGVAQERYRLALHRLSETSIDGDTVRERVVNLLLRELHAEQREPLLTSAMYEVLGSTNPEYTAAIERVTELHQRMLLQAAGDGGKAPPTAILKLLPLVVDVFVSATRAWLRGATSAADARLYIITGCRVLDLSEDEILADVQMSLESPRDNRRRRSTS